MKKKLLLILPLLVLASCVTNQPSTSNTTSSVTSTVPVELAMSLKINGVAKENKIYDLLIGDELIITPVFNDPSRAEEVTYTATESGIFGESVSSNVILDGSKVTAVGKKDKIKITATSTSGLTDFFEIKVSAMADEEYPNIIQKLTTALTKESEASSGNYVYNSLSAEFNVAKDGSLEIIENKNDVITHKYSTYEDNLYYDVTMNENQTEVAKATVKESKPTSFGYYVTTISSWVTQNGLVNTIKYLMENSSYFTSTSAYNHAEIMFMEEENTYLIDSEYVSSDFGGNKTLNQLFIEITFNKNDALTYFTYDNQQFDKTTYDFENEKFLVENATPASSTIYEGELNYSEKQETISFNPQILYFTDYNVILKDSKENEGFSHEVGKELTFTYGNTISPSTASSTIDPLSFVSSSNQTVANINENNKIKCLAEGTTTLTFTSKGGVTKTFELTVTPSKAPALTETQIKEILTATTYVKIDLYSNISNQLTFTETQGTYVDNTASSTVTFNYAINGTSLTISNSSDASAFQKLSSVEFNDDYSIVTLTFKNAWGNNKVELKASK